MAPGYGFSTQISQNRWKFNPRKGQISRIVNISKYIDCDIQNPQNISTNGLDYVEMV